MDTNGQVFGYNNSTTGTHLRCAPGVDQCYPPTGTFSLVGGESHKVPPGDIVDSVANRIVAANLQILYVQLFKSDELIFIDQFTGFLMSEVIAPIGRTSVRVAKRVHDLSIFGAILRKLLFLPLQSSDVLLVLLHPSLPFNLLAVAEMGKGSQSQVNADNIIIDRKGQRLNLTGKASEEITNGIAPNGQCLDFTNNGAMQLDSNITNLGKSQPIVGYPEAPLLVSETIVVAFALKAWVANLIFTGLYTTKKALKYNIHALLYVLQYLGVDFGIKRLGYLPTRQQIVSFVHRKMVAGLLVGFLADCQRIVVNQTANFKRSFEARSLGASGKQAILVGQSHVYSIAHDM